MTEIIQFEQHEVHVRRQAKRRSLAVRIAPFQPIQILTNITTDERTILKFLFERKDWIEKNLSKFEKRFEPKTNLVLKKGMQYPFRGILKTIQPVITFNRKIFFSETEKEILLHIPRNDWSQAVLEKEFPELEGAFIKFYKTMAITELSAKMLHWGNILNLHPAKVSFRFTSSRWGSCTSRKTISLNWKLICMDEELQDYVIVHELCHLAHMNHSKAFWDLVETQMPNRKEIQKKLYEKQFTADFLKTKF